MKYIFILGRNPALSVAEIIRAVPGADILSVSNETAVVECEPLSPGFLNLLGGTIKIAEAVSEFNDAAAVNEEILRETIPPRDGRIIFGLSAYGHFSGIERRAMYMAGLALKKLIKSEGRRCRLVVSRETQLSSVVVAKNKLIEEGAEFIIVKSKQKIILGRTIAIQEFEAYGERDFDRPGRSARRGMLPPKLSQIMINLAGADGGALIDPFCGSGTVLGEALLMGFRKVVGSDISEEAVRDSIAYLKWLEEKHNEFRGRWRVTAADARLVDEVFVGEQFRAVVAEPLLGPPQKGSETREQLSKMMMNELTPLYAGALAAIRKILSDNGTAVFAFPVFGKGRDRIFVPLEKIASGFEVVPLIPPQFEKDGLFLTPSGGVLYERPDQLLGREIVLMKKV
jgi:tRNA G10  N-methylase Trm11